MARKIVLTSVVLLVDEKRAFLRLIIAVLISACYAVFVMLTRPYRRFEDDMFAAGASLMLLLIFVGADWTNLFLAIEERTTIVDASAIIGLDNTDPIVNTLIILVFSMFALFAATTVAGIRRLSGIQTIRLVENKLVPELTLASEMKWHIFNSHIWSTGQDAVAVIKNQLQQLLPGVGVFLDIDDLKDIGALEKYIERSQVILFFLSRGYFKSKNCLREIRAALDQGKPIVLVQEARPTRPRAAARSLSCAPSAPRSCRRPSSTPAGSSSCGTASTSSSWSRLR